MDYPKIGRNGKDRSPIAATKGQFMTRPSSSLLEAKGLAWASNSISHSLRTTGSWLSERVWVWPLIGMAILSLVGWWVHHSIESTMKASLASELKTLLDVEAAMMQSWLTSQKNNAEALANNGEARRQMLELIDQTDQLTAQASNEAGTSAVAEKQRSLAKSLVPSLTMYDYFGFVLMHRDGTIVAATESDLIGRRDVYTESDWFLRVIEGESTVSRPFKSIEAITDENGRRRTEVPTMMVAAPIRDANLMVAGVLALRVRPDKEFTKILQLGRIGETGETYAFNRQGLMVSNSRFDDALVLFGIIPDIDRSRSILQIQLRDPQGDMTSGYRPTVRRSDLPLTKMAESAILGESDVDVDGYNDYRGVPVVGAWTWLNEYDFGIATEQDKAEAFRPLTILQRFFWGLLALLTLTSATILAFSVMLTRLQRKAQQAAIAAKQLGQYQLMEKLGEGAMGTVYRGRHAMLRRDTAIKLINSDNVSERAVAGFEREVQITSQLNNPSTVAVFDFGRTPEGIFYYAMEFLDGIDLQKLVNEYGPQEPARVIYIMSQVCDSLYEAHTHALVHRDIKPANIMLNRRGGKSDVVKVLDFGLVQAEEDLRIGTGLAGTPLYMSPEAIQFPSLVDARSDVYSVGGVAYFLATGRPLFSASSTAELCQKHISEIPVPPSEIIEGFPTDLESVIMSCLEKDRSRRPQTARDLARNFQSCRDSQWNSDAADRWWERHDRQSKLIRAPKRSTSSAVTIKADKTQRDVVPDKASSPQQTPPPSPSFDDFSLSQEDAKGDNPGD